MILRNVQINDQTGNRDIHITNGSVTAVSPTTENGAAIIFQNAIAFSGLINSHDHLDFNSFPLLGNKIYDNYVDWGNDIHTQNNQTITEILRIPKKLRVQWSLYKNMLNGVTTVVQHGEHFNVTNDLIDVLQDCVSIHSVRQEKKWKLKLNKPRFNDWPVVIHIGEGTDQDAVAEINELLRWNLLRKKLIGIHGVAMSAKQAKRFEALIWCPDSNYFLLGKTAGVNELKSTLPVVFGTDSTLTGHWSIWEQLRIALRTGMVTEDELFDMVTTIPAKVWGLPHKGIIKPGAKADIVVARAGTNNGFLHSFFSLKPEDILLVLHNGKVRLLDEVLYDQMLLQQAFLPEQFFRVGVGNTVKYIYGNLPGLMNHIRQYAPGIVFPGISLI